MLNYINTIDFTSIRKLNLNDKEQSYETLSFTDLNIFIGPNGSGKSTILEAILFALYGELKTKGSKDLIRNSSVS